MAFEKKVNQYHSVPNLLRLEHRNSLVRSPARLIFFPKIDDSHCDRIHSSLTAVHCFDNGCVGKQPVAWKEYCLEYWLTHYHTMPHFEALKIYSSGKKCDERRKCLLQAISPFLTMFSTLYYTSFSF